MRYVLIGTECAGGDGYIIPRTLKMAAIPFLAEDDEKAKRIVQIEYKHISDPTLYKEVK